MSLIAGAIRAEIAIARASRVAAHVAELAAGEAASSGLSENGVAR